MKVKISKIKDTKNYEGIIIPKYAKEGDAGLDLTSIGIIQTPKYIEHLTGLTIEIPEGYAGFLFPRSSITDKGMILKNSVGVIDSSYRGEIRIRFQDLDVPYLDEYKVGERVAQLIILPVPNIELVEVEELSLTARGEGGFGSTNKS